MTSTNSAQIDAVRDHLADAGVLARPLRRVLAMLADGPHPLEQLIRIPAVPHRTVEGLLAAAGSDVAADRDGYSLVPGVREEYRKAFELVEAPTPDGALDRIRGYIESGPSPQAALDHVTATPETVLRRAEWLRDTYDLDGARVLCLGDHDLTSLALCQLNPSISVTVVDLDERILAHIDRIAAEHCFPVRTLHADLRFGLPPAVARSADLVFTDPPYTPEGIGLFAARAAESLASARSRVVIAYGFSDRSPALGHKVQQELLRLGFVFEAILPGFHRYFGAQAIGSASDLYVCQPTAHTRKQAQRQSSGIYTHGPQSVEARETTVTEDFLRAVGDQVGGSVARLREPGWAKPIPAREDTPAFDLRADPGPWLLRMLLACNADRAAFVVGNKHPDVVSESAQRALSDLVAPKYALRFHRGSPDSRHAVVVASGAGGSPMREVLRRAHGKFGNIWREALIEASGGTLSQRQARDLIRDLVPHAADLDLRPIDIPRSRLAALVAAGS